MGINLVTFYNSTVTPQDDALIYENALPGSGMIYGGKVTIKNANTLHVTAGHGALCGRKFTIEETDVPVQLTSSGTLNGRLYIHMDLSNVDEPITLEVERASTLTPPVQQSNVNITDGIYEIDLATFQISTSTISNLVYVAPFIHYEFLKEVIIAPVEKTNVASQNYVVGRHLMLNNILYKVTAAISKNAAITIGGNCKVADNITTQISNLTNAIEKNKKGTVVNLWNYNTYANRYTLTSDGYLFLDTKTVTANPPTRITADVYDSSDNRLFAISAITESETYSSNAVFVKKGMKVFCSRQIANTDIVFVPLV